MLYKLLHFLSGYCLIKIEGNHQERFLNLCVNKRILLWNVVKKENATFFYISKKGSEFLAEICQKTGCEVFYIKKAGLPYLFYQYRKRKIALIFLLLCSCLLYILSGRLWRIEIVGEKKYTQKEMVSYLNQQKITYGVPLSKISCEKLEESLREYYEDIAWVSCEIKGTMLRISLSEVLKPKQKEKDDKIPGHLIANKSGVIDSIITREGVPKVKKGSRVKKGQILISGTVELMDDFGEKISTTRVCASGDIYIRRMISYKDKLPYTYYEKKYVGKPQKTYQIECHMPKKRLLVELPGASNKSEYVEVERKKYPLRLGKHFYLPVILHETIQRQYIPKQKTMTKKEAKAMLGHRLKGFLAEYEAKGVEILKNNVRIDCDKKECTAQGMIMIRERIGKKKKIGGRKQRGVQK